MQSRHRNPWRRLQAGGSGLGATLAAGEKTQRCDGSARTDQVGKAFIVVCRGVRKCVICDELFTWRASAEHAKVACYPAVPGVRPIGRPNEHR